MKLIFGKQAYEQLRPADREGLIPIPCDCNKGGPALLDCESCEGGGIVYECPISKEQMAVIEENFRRQGVSLGKKGTN